MVLIHVWSSPAHRAHTGSYGWDLHPAFNEIARATLRRYAGRVAAATLGMLDVYPMTVTRPDARQGSEGGEVKTDCLHPMLPGLPDWWNHLLLTVLEAVAEQEGGGGGLRRVSVGLQPYGPGPE